mmetsp:Transcript_11970/g.29851  ORF Transcript_11970/g.29851 Transcript_11970/m.29851 type:complete len:504 (+) Transcript_11970:31-1542(+)
MDTYEQAKKIAVKAEAHLTPAKKLTAEITDFCTAPVIGPVVFWFLHRIVALFTVVVFLYTLSVVAPTWFSEKLTFADVEYLTDYQLPDVYMCLDGETMKKFISKEKQSTKKNKCRGELGGTWRADCEFEMMDGAKSTGFYDALGRVNEADGDDVYGKGGTVMQFSPGGLSDDTRCAAYTLAYFNLKTGKDDEGECPVEVTKLGSNWSPEQAPEMAVLNDRLGFDPWLPSDHTGDGPPAPGYDDTAGFLAGLLPNATGEIINDDGTEATVTVPAYCYRNIVRVGAKSYYETNQDLVLGTIMRIWPPEAMEGWKGGFAWQVFFTEPGVPPYKLQDGTWDTNATRLFVSGLNTETKMDLRPYRFKDETVGMSSHTLDFQQSTNYQTPVHFTTPKNGVENWIFFTFLHFARKVTIRYKTRSEMLAEIGGLWAAATLIMATFFSQSGTVGPKNKKPAVIFKYLPSKLRKQWIQENNEKLESAGAEAKDQTTGGPVPSVPTRTRDHEDP